MQTRSNIQSIIRSILFITLIGMFYVYTSALFNQDNPLLLFLTSSAILAFLLVLLNPKYGMYSYRDSKKPILLILLLASAVSVFIRLLTFSFTESSFLSFNTIGIIACSVISLNLIFLITKSIYTDNSAFLAAFLYALWPTHIFIGNSDVKFAVAETMILFSILLITISGRNKSIGYGITTTIAASFAFMSALILNNSYIILALPFLVFYIIYSLSQKLPAEGFKKSIAFFGSAVVLLAGSILSDEFLDTNFWTAIGFKAPVGDNVSEMFAFASDTIQKMWGSTIDTGKDSLTYLATVFLLLILLTYIVGILNSLKDLQPQYLLIVPFPLLLTVAYIFMPFDITTYLCVVPFLLIVAANGITGTYTYIPLPLKERYTGATDIPVPNVELDESFTIPGRWGYIVKKEDNQEIPKVPKNTVSEDITEDPSEQEEEVLEETLAEEENGEVFDEVNHHMPGPETEQDINVTDSSEQEEVIVHEDDEVIISEIKSLVVDLTTDPDCSEEASTDPEEEEYRKEICRDRNKLSYIYDIPVADKEPNPIKGSLFSNDNNESLQAKKAALKKAYSYRNIQLTNTVLSDGKKDSNRIDTMVDQLYENKNAKYKKH